MADIVKEMGLQGFRSIMGYDVDTEMFFALFQHEATRLSCITVGLDQFQHTPIHHSVYHYASTLAEAIKLAVEATKKPL